VSRWNIDSVHGNELSAGIQLEVVARRIAQETANRLGESVYLYEVGSDEKPEEFTPEEGEDPEMARADHQRARERDE